MLLPLFLSLTLPSPTAAKPRLALPNVDFADPSITYNPQDSSWYAFGTQHNKTHVQVARLKSNSLHTGIWHLLPSTDLLPDPGPWTNASSPQVWAPDVQYLSSTDSYVLYYSAKVALPHHRGQPYNASKERHCIGAATSKHSITGPYIPLSTPLICPGPDAGGAIDASGYRDEADESRWVLYKIDGGGKTPSGPPGKEHEEYEEEQGGLCGNGDGDENDADGAKKGKPTPLRIQRVDERDGLTKIGEDIKILDRDGGKDGPLVEAPSLVRLSGVDGGLEERYVLFYSSHCFNSREYDVKYAVAKGVMGPYRRMGQLIGKGKGTEDWGLEKTGGATGVDGGGGLVFHADCGAGRCMYEAEYVVEGGRLKIV